MTVPSERRRIIWIGLLFGTGCTTVVQVPTAVARRQTKSAHATRSSPRHLTVLGIVGYGALIFIVSFSRLSLFSECLRFCGVCPQLLQRHEHEHHAPALCERAHRL